MDYFFSIYEVFKIDTCNLIHLSSIKTLLEKPYYIIKEREVLSKEFYRVNCGKKWFSVPDFS